MKQRSGAIAVWLIVWTLCFDASGQSFPIDEAGRIVYQEVVPLPLSDSALQANAIGWLKEISHQQNGTLLHADTLPKSAGARLELPVYAQSGMLRKLSGVVSYEVWIDIKPGKYRYTFRNFVFHYYTQDRTYKMVKTGKTKPLEEPKAAGWQKLWTQHRTTTDAAVQQARVVLQQQMKAIPLVQKTEKKKTEW